MLNLNKSEVLTARLELAARRSPPLSQCWWSLCSGWSVSSQHSLIPGRLAELRTAPPVGQYCPDGELAAASRCEAGLSDPAHPLPHLPVCFAVV